MDATSFVAVAGAISTPVIALAGFRFNERRGRDDRASSRQLAADAHDHERKLADAAREHERELAREARVSADVRQLGFVFLLEDVINRTNPIITPAPDPPPMPREEEIRKVMARVSTVASEEVIAEIEAMWAAQRGFVIQSQTLDRIRGGPDDKGQFYKGLQAARDVFREHARALERAIREEVRA